MQTATQLFSSNRYSEVDFNPKDSRLDLLLLYMTDRIKLAKLSNAIDEPIMDLTKMEAVPNLNPEAKRYLEIKTTNLTEEEAIDIGAEILQQTLGQHSSSNLCRSLCQLQNPCSISILQGSHPAFFY